MVADKIRAITGKAALALFLLGWTSASLFAQTPLRKVVIAAGTQVLNS